MRGWTGGGERGYGDKVGGIGGGGAESGVEGWNRGWRGRGAAVEGTARGVWKDWGGKLIFLNRKFRENGSFKPIS